MTARFIDLESVGPARLRWLWQNRIPYGGLTILVGDPQASKSLLACEIIAKVTTGKPMFNCRGLRSPHGVILLAGEDNLSETIKPRLVAAGAATRLVRVLDCSRGLLRLPADVSLIEREMGEHQARLVVVDPLMQFVDGNANSDQSMRKSIWPLADLARRTGRAVLLVHHLNKSARGSALYRSAGTIGIIGLVRSALMVAQRPGATDQRVVAHVKSNLGRLAEASYIARSTTQETLKSNGSAKPNGPLTTWRAFPSAKRVQLAEAIQVLFSILGEEKVDAKTAKSLAMDCGVSAATLKRAKQALGVQSQREGFGPRSQFFWRLDDDHPLTRQLREQELSNLVARLFEDPDDDDDDGDPADWWKPKP